MVEPPDWRTVKAMLDWPRNTRNRLAVLLNVDTRTIDLHGLDWRNQTELAWRCRYNDMKRFSELKGSGK